MFARTIIALCLVACGCREERPRLALTDEGLMLAKEPLVRTRDVLRYDYLNLPELDAVLADARGAHSLCADIETTPQVTFAVLKRVMFTCGSKGEVSIGLRINGVLRGVAIISAQAARADVKLVLAPNKLTLDSKELPSTNPDELRAAMQGLPREVLLRVDDRVTAGTLVETVDQLSRAGFAAAIYPAL